MPKQSTPIECRCRCCGTLFSLPAGRVAAGRGTYCSHQCTYIDRRHFMSRPDNAWCAVCGTGFRIRPSRIAAGKGRCCSRACWLVWHAAEPLWQRIWRQVDYGGPDCWEWTARKTPDGYGAIFIRDDQREGAVHVTREIWRLIHGVYPTLCCHHCDNRACCRPSHLYDGTPQSNMDDMHRRGRARPVWGGVHGERSHFARLGADQVRAIRDRYAAGGITQTALAHEYGVSQSAVSSIVRMNVWKRTT